MKSNAPVGILVCAVVVVLASFMPWGSFAGSPSIGSGFFPGGSPFGGLQLSITINAWNGNITFLGVTIPNWVPVMAAVAVGVMAVLKAYGTWDAPAAANICLSIYGVLHLALTVALLGSKGNLGIGSIVTLVCFVALLILSVKAARVGAPVRGPVTQV